MASQARAKAVEDATAKLVPRYDPLTSTESLYKDTPLRALRYSKVPPKLAEQVPCARGALHAITCRCTPGPLLAVACRCVLVGPDKCCLRRNSSHAYMRYMRYIRRIIDATCIAYAT